MNHIGALSGGKDSTAMALRLTELNPDIGFTWVCTPTGNEPDAWFEHMRVLRERVGPVTPIMLSGGMKGLIDKYNSLPNWRQRWCTRQLKIEPFAKFLRTQAPARCYVGLRADEPEREGGDYYRHMPDVEMVFPLREWGWGLDEVISYLRSREQSIPERTDCKLCFFQKLIEWWDLWKNDPDSYAEGERYEALTGHTWRSPGRDTWPTSLADLRGRFERGHVPPGAQRDLLRDMQCRVCSL
jgi:hypothetical protein